MDAIFFIINVLCIIFMGGLYNLARAIQNNLLMEITNTYLFFGVILLVLTVAWMYLTGDKDFEIPDMRDFFVSFSVSFWFPFLALAWRVCTCRELTLWFVPMLTSVTPPSGYSPSYRFIKILSLALAIDEAKLISYITNIFVGPIESGLFHVLLPLIFYEKIFREGSFFERAVLTALISNIFFSVLHLPFGGMGTAFYAFIAGVVITISFLYLYERGIRVYSAVGIAHSLYNILIILLTG